MCLAGLATGALADTAQIQASRDNTLYEDPAGSLSNGIGVGMFCGRNGSGSARRALVRFDVAGAVPAGSTIDSVTLTLNVSQSISPDVSCSLHRVSADWGEGTSNSSTFGGGGGAPATTGDATWIHRFYNTEMWATSGGDFAAQASATRLVGGPGSYIWNSTPELVADVQAWLDAPATNFGWIVIGDESAIGTAKRFDTHEHTVAGVRPLLVVDFTPGCYPDCNQSNTLTIADFGCFQAAFAAGNLYADCNNSGTLTIADFGCFQAAFAAGCP